MDILRKAIDTADTNHTVEIHPHIDHLYRVKNFIAEKGGSAHLNDIKRMGVNPNIVDKLPRDSKGRVTTQDVDKHIESLPKTKVNVKVFPYTGWGGEQMHRRSNPQYVLAAHMHPEEYDKLDDSGKSVWNSIKGSQHTISPDKAPLADQNQMGWIRVDPHHNKSDAPQLHDHWHLDEIQSDFQNAKKIRSKRGISHANDVAGSDKMLDHLSMGHDDPQHALHSVANAMGRKLGVQSTSMDMPKDQAKKSLLRTTAPVSYYLPHVDERIPEFPSTRLAHLLIDEGVANNEKHMSKVWHSKPVRDTIEEETKYNPDFSTAVEKIGGTDVLQHMATGVHMTTDNGLFDGRRAFNWGNFEVDGKRLSGDEKDALGSFFLQYQHHVATDLLDHPRIKEARDAHVREHQERIAREIAARKAAERELADKPPEAAPLPVHQINTYEKRPKKLGMTPVDKQELLGDIGPQESAQQVQYAKLHKKISNLLDLLKKEKS